MNISAHIDTFKQEMERRNYSPCTIKNYASNLTLFFAWSKSDHPKNIHEYDIKEYLGQFSEANTQRSHHGAIKKFYEICLRQPEKFKFIPYCKKAQILPVILSVNEMQRLISACTNLKHKAIICVMYSTGVRVSELLGIRLKDIDRQNMVIHIMNGKGGKQRQVVLNKDVLALLGQYYKQNKPKEYLFEGQFGGQYSSRSVNELLKTYADKAGINKRIYAHLIRHCTGTHLTEAGVNMGLIQRSFGHNSPNTTALYQHISPNLIANMYSPIQNVQI